MTFALRSCRPSTDHRSRVTAAACSILLLSLTACTGTDTSDAAAAVETIDSAGVQIMMNHGVGDAADLELVEDLRIGAVDSEREELLFSGVRGMLVDDDGRILVGNNQTKTVRVFDRNGTFVREFGGRGEGPSEIPNSLDDLQWAGDRVVLIDWQRGGKAVVYDTAGEFSRSWRMTLPDGTRAIVAGYTPSGWVTILYGYEVPEQPVPGRAYPQTLRLHRIAASLDSVGELLVDLPPRELYGSTTTHGLDWGLFDPPQQAAFDAAGRFHRAQGDGYRIDVWDEDGTHVRSIRREYDPIPLAQEDVEEHRRRAAVQIRELMGDRADEAMIQQQIDGSMERIDEQATFPRPDHRPPLGEVLVARDGSIWVERLDAREPAEWWTARMFGGRSGPPDVPTRWDLFAPDGRFRGSTVLPPRFAPMAVSADAVVGVLRDDLDVEYVVRFRLAGRL